MERRNSDAARSEDLSRKGFKLIETGIFVRGSTSVDLAKTGGWLLSHVRYPKKPSRTNNPAPTAIAICSFENFMTSDPGPERDNIGSSLARQDFTAQVT